MNLGISVTWFYQLPCLTIGYSKETKLFNNELKFLIKKNAILKILKRYIKVIITISKSFYMKTTLSKQIFIINRPTPMIIYHATVWG